MVRLLCSNCASFPLPTYVDACDRLVRRVDSDVVGRRSACAATSARVNPTDPFGKLLVVVMIQIGSYLYKYALKSPRSLARSLLTTTYRIVVLTMEIEGFLDLSSAWPY